MTYNGIVVISNEIRFILNTARQVNLAAQNASLAARRAGNVRGFQAVSAELKSFSLGLATAMHEMSQNILGISQAVSGIYRQARYAKYFETTADLAGDVLLLSTAKSQSSNLYSQSMSMLAKKIQSLGQQLARSILICRNGRVLARSAMIESASGGEWENMLRNVAGDIERTIIDVDERLKVIGVHLNAELKTL